MAKFEDTPSSRKVKKVVITGGPVAGKTTAISHLRSALRDSIVAVPEVATSLLSTGFPMPGRDLDWTQEWQNTFQDAVFGLQYLAEKAAVIAAGQKAGKLVVTDRGLLDGAAYFSSRQEFAERYDLNVDEAMAGYDTVIHLESMALQGKHVFETLRENNSARFRPYEQVLALEHSVRAAWDGHPNRIVVNELDLDSRLLAIEGIVRAVHYSS